MLNAYNSSPSPYNMGQGPLNVHEGVTHLVSYVFHFCQAILSVFVSLSVCVSDEFMVKEAVGDFFLVVSLSGAI